MDPHLLRTFTVVARLRSFSAAAVELGYTQSAVSQHVAALEADLGARLLDRRPVAPTVAGERLLTYAGPILLRLAAARTDLARLAAPRPGRLRVGATPLAVPAAATLAAGEAAAGLVLRVTARNELVRQVATDDLDLGLLDGFTAPNDPLPVTDLGPTEVSVHGQEPAVVTLPRTHPLAGRSALALADLADARWIDAPDVAAPLPQLRAATGTDGFRSAVRYDGTEVAGLLAAVAAGHGLAVLPAGTVRAHAELVGVDVREPRLVHRVELIRPAGSAGDRRIGATGA
ncbi:DNA-binding transcriptional LysR family regulator [Micromonospora kangleipakensis]|uniref:DNA-binding transcriptional LysR family regulator n=1 Tax=Micromonospora kangleipakensis TaxID=1077942 RepID=A0A4V2GD78_9ACTN|nr:LysR family transcriptional regulator [Micromonospora kangleipakensis]RZU74806.1 DNA-binding transcriptional LysR family regulator [Micromonospora kangleipakensis]